jgi:small subunit ribosomal protein S11
MLRSALATSSRIGLDFALPSRGFASSALARAERDGPRFRWSPLDPAPYRRSTGQTDRAPTHQLSVFSSRNNVMLTLSDSLGPLFPTISGGSDMTFKKGQRGGYEAAHQAALKMFKKVAELEDECRTLRPTDRIWLKVSFNGTGHGRTAVSDAISGPDGAEIRTLVSRVEDRTPFRIGGTRGRSPRRV